MILWLTMQHAFLQCSQLPQAKLMSKILQAGFAKMLCKDNFQVRVPTTEYC